MLDLPSGTHVALAVPSRRRLFELLQASSEPLDVAELATAVDVHVTTARFHLRQLERAGLVRAVPDRAGRPGRPRQLYLAVLDAESLTDESAARQRTLATMLAGALADDQADGSRRAEEAGRRWADQLPAPPEATSWDEGAVTLRDLFDQLGFAPEPAGSRPARRLELHSCPFRDVARAYPSVVCSMHLGLMKATLERMGLPDAAEAASLHPFAEPGLCVVEVSEPSGAGPQ